MLIVYSLAISISFVICNQLWLSSLLAVLLLCALIYYLCRDVALILPYSYIKIRLDGENIMLITRNGNEIPCQLARDSLVTPVLTIVNFLPANKQRVRSVMIFPDSMGKEAFRELRVLLKWSSEPV
jgi:hypothetical protein